MAKQVSSPIKSANFKGPIGTFVPKTIVLSMSSRVPMPSKRVKIASLMYGIKIRFAINPGTSFETVVVFPMASANVFVMSMVSLLVWHPDISSTRRITGTGFIKCIPTNRSGPRKVEANFVIEMELVLEATMALGLQSTLPSCLKIASFLGKSSEIAYNL
jgi:hypothetical protein